MNKKELFSELFELARAVIDELYEFKSENTGNYDDQLAIIAEKYEKD